MNMYDAHKYAFEQQGGVYLTAPHATAPQSQLCCQDIVTRYASQTGHHVSRRFGWDCHGLPVEQETEKLLGESCTHNVCFSECALLLR